MRLFIAALLVMLGTQAWAECGDLCKKRFWLEKATTSDVKAKLEAGADVMARDAYDQTPLHFAAEYGEESGVIESLLEAGADVMAKDEEGYTPLHAAAGSDTPENIQALIEAGADVMARNMYGDTPLHFAAEDGQESGLIESLLEAGADPKAINDSGKTPWDLAQYNNALKDTKGYLALKLAQ